MYFFSKVIMILGFVTVQHGLEMHGHMGSAVALHFAYSNSSKHF